MRCAAASYIGLRLILGSHVNKELFHVPVEDGAQIGVQRKRYDRLVVPSARDLSQHDLLERDVDFRVSIVPVGRAGSSKGEESEHRQRIEKDGIQPLPEGVHGSAFSAAKTLRSELTTPCSAHVAEMFKGQSSTQLLTPTRIVTPHRPLRFHT